MKVVVFDSSSEENEVAEESITSFVKHRDAYLDGEIRVETV
jgi:hypothetical protein